MELKDIIKEAEALGSPRTKKRYVSQGAQEPVFGLSIKDLKPIAKRIMACENSQQIAYDLFDTGNYDLMYLAGMAVDPHKMTEAMYDHWLDKSYFYMLSDFTVAVCLSETDFAFPIADRWIASGQDLPMSAGYSTYSWMLASRKDSDFQIEKIRSHLEGIQAAIHEAPNRTRYAMYYFVYNVGLSYLPLQDEAMQIAEKIGDTVVLDPRGKSQIYNAAADIRGQIEKGRLGFKRRYVRC